MMGTGVKTNMESIAEGMENPKKRPTTSHAKKPRPKSAGSVRSTSVASSSVGYVKSSRDKARPKSAGSVRSGSVKIGGGGGTRVPRTGDWVTAHLSNWEAEKKSEKSNRINGKAIGTPNKARACLNETIRPKSAGTYRSERVSVNTSARSNKKGNSSEARASKLAAPSAMERVESLLNKTGVTKKEGEGWAVNSEVDISSRFSSRASSVSGKSDVTGFMITGTSSKFSSKNPVTKSRKSAKGKRPSTASTSARKEFSEAKARIETVLSKMEKDVRNEKKELEILGRSTTSTARSNSTRPKSAYSRTTGARSANNSRPNTGGTRVTGDTRATGRSGDTTGRSWELSEPASTRRSHYEVAEDMWETKTKGTFERHDYMPGREVPDQYGEQFVKTNTMFKINHGW